MQTAKLPLLVQNTCKCKAPDAYLILNAEISVNASARTSQSAAGMVNVHCQLGWIKKHLGWEGELAQWLRALVLAKDPNSIPRT